MLRDGRAYETTWRRAEATSGAAFVRPDGARTRFGRGQGWLAYQKR